MTLNQEIQTIKEIADDHYQLNHFYFGDNWEWLSNGNVTYPALFLVLAGSNVSITNKNKTTTFDIYILDKSSNDERNETEVLSDTEQILIDVLAQLKHPYYEWEVDQDMSIEHFTEFTEDSLSGCKGTITLTTPYGVNRCQVPSSYSYPEEQLLLGADDLFYLLIEL